MVGWVVSVLLIFLCVGVFCGLYIGFIEPCYFKGKLKVVFYPKGDLYCACYPSAGGAFIEACHFAEVGLFPADGF